MGMKATLQPKVNSIPGSMQGAPDFVVAYHPDASFHAVVEALRAHEDSLRSSGQLPGPRGGGGRPTGLSGPTYWLACFACHKHDKLWQVRTHPHDHF